MANQNLKALRNNDFWLRLRLRARFALAERHAKAKRHAIETLIQSQTTNHNDTFLNQVQETKQSHRSPLRASKN